MENKSLCDKVSELASKYYYNVKESSYHLYQRVTNEPRRLCSRLREDPWYFASVGTAFIAPTLAAAITAYVMEHHNYSQDTITNYAIWTKNAGFFIVNIPMHLYTHRKKFETKKDWLNETKTIISSNLFGLVANTILQPRAHSVALNYGMSGPWAVLLTYPPVGFCVTYLKVLYDDFMGAIGLKKKIK